MDIISRFMWEVILAEIVGSLSALYLVKSMDRLCKRFRPKTLIIFSLIVYFRFFWCIPIVFHFQSSTPVKESNAIVRAVGNTETAGRVISNLSVPDKPFFSIKVIFILAAIVWLIGFCIEYRKVFSVHHDLMRSAKLGHPVKDETLLAIFETVKAELGIRYEILFVEVEGAVSPFAVGYRCRYVVFPKGLSQLPVDCESMIRHELYHYKRFDFICKWFVMLVCCLQWFNRLTGKLYLKFDRLLELACDQSVIAKKDDAYRKRYADTIEYISEKFQKVGDFEEFIQGLGFASETKSDVEIRLEALRNPTIKKAWHWTFVTISAVLFITLFQIGVVVISPLRLPMLDSFKFSLPWSGTKPAQAEMKDEPPDIPIEQVLRMPVDNPIKVLQNHIFNPNTRNRIIFYTEYGSHVYAPISGEIVFMGFDTENGLGNCISIKNEYITVTVGHISLTDDWSMGDNIEKGNILGIVSESGDTKKHICEINVIDKNGFPVDLSFLTEEYTRFML